MLVERMLFCMFHFVQGRRLARRLRTCVCARVPKKRAKTGFKAQRLVLLGPGPSCVMCCLQQHSLEISMLTAGRLRCCCLFRWFLFGSFVFFFREVDHNKTENYWVENLFTLFQWDSCWTHPTRPLTTAEAMSST